MLEQCFLKPNTTDRIRASWLGEPIERYVTWLTEQGYAARSVGRRVPMLMHFADYSATHCAKTWEELPAHVDPFVDAWVRKHGRRCKDKEARRQVDSAARNPVGQMLRLILSGYAGHKRTRPPQPFAESAPGFFSYLREECGLRPASVALYAINLRRLDNTYGGSSWLIFASYRCPCSAAFPATLAKRSARMP